jgi:hypothetical protein
LVELPQCALSDFDSEIKFELDATLLQTEAGPAHQNIAVDEVLCCPLCDLLTAVISAVEGPPIDHGLSHRAVAMEGVVSSASGTVQDRRNPSVGVPGVVVQLENPLRLLDGHFVPNSNDMRHLFSPHFQRPRGRQEFVLELRELFVAGTCEEILLLPLLINQSCLPRFYHVGPAANFIYNSEGWCGANYGKGGLIELLCFKNFLGHASTRNCFTTALEN